MSSILYYTIEAGCAAITRVVSDEAQLILPQEIEGCPVTALGEDCFAGTSPETVEFSGGLELRRELSPKAKTYDNKTLKRVILPHTLKTVGARCFAHCVVLPRVDLPQSITELGDRVFHYCNALQRIELPDNITVLPEYTFAECRHLLRISLPHHIHSIGRCCFYNCTRLERLDLPDALQNIGDRMLMNCFELHELSFKVGVNAGALLPEIDRVLRVNVNLGDQVIQMVLPEYATEYEELIYAKQFRTHDYGSGHLYRSCFSDRDIDFNLYDDYFYFCIREDPPVLVAELAFDRLRWPVQLRPGKEEEYWDYLTQHVKELAQVLLRQDDMDALEFLLSTGKMDQSAIEILLDEAERKENVRFVSRLLEASGANSEPDNFGADKLFEL